MYHNVILPYCYSSAVVCYNWMKPAKQSNLYRKEHARTWDKNIICLPQDYATMSGQI